MLRFEPATFESKIDILTTAPIVHHCPSQSCGKSGCKQCLSLICSNYISGTANNKTFKCHNENTSCDSKWIIYVISCPICNLQYVGQSNNLKARMNGHRSDFRLYAADKISKMDNKLLYDHLICHDINYFHVCIVDMIHVGNNTESQLEELLSRKERKWTLLQFILIFLLFLLLNNIQFYGKITLRYFYVLYKLQVYMLCKYSQFQLFSILCQNYL